MRHWLLVAVLLVDCGKPPVGPDPVPSPSSSPTPAPVVILPLHVEGNRFVNSVGQEITLRGVSYIPPDSKAYGWPSRVSYDILKRISDAGGNFVSIRVGPFISPQEAESQVAYRMVDGKVDLDEWNPRFWTDLRDFLYQAADLGIYVEIDLIDGWTLKYGLSPWKGSNNINGVDEGTCEIYSRGPGYRQGQWLNKVGEETHDLPNVIYQIGNENSVGSCGSYLSADWELGVYGHMKRNLAFRGVDRPVGTNSERADLENGVDFIERHSCKAQNAGSKPTGVNEWNCTPLSPEQFCALYTEARTKGSWFVLWGDNMSAGAWTEALKCWTR